MAYRDLHAFLDKLEELGELHRVRVEVDPVLEIAEITDRMCKSPHGGKALLFERVTGSAFPVVTNIFGSYRRICAALEIGELEALARRMEELFRQVPSTSPRDKIAALPQWGEFSRFLPKRVTYGVCREIIDHDPDLGAYPVLTNWPGDGRPVHSGRFITLPLVFTRDPETGAFNCGMYRVAVFDGRTVGLHWSAKSGGAGHYEKYRARGERMPLAIAVGGDPAVIYAASVPFPAPIDEMQMAGFLRQSPVEVVQCLNSELWVPANAEMVLEGYLEPGEMRREGAFGNHTGFYGMHEDVPVMHITCITRRREMVYPATVVGPPPMEDCYMAKANERLLLPFIRLELPEVVDINLPLEGIFHGCAVVAIKKEGPGHARKVMDALWGKGWLAASRLLVIVDADVDIHDLPVTSWRVINGVEWRRDLIVGESPFDKAFAAQGSRYSGGRLGIDATRKMPGEGFTGEWPEEVSMADSIKQLVDRRWREYGLSEE
ncbi:MAG: 3-octaprenyl-4-hydroxybenzoate carboxy-lyase [Geobacteraceae bacterium]|nr:MAG: 3-octaprenyl-4-hydroxybenzoate carboxy-lyase [Geobacteraceae bacterium]